MDSWCAIIDIIILDCGPGNFVDTTDGTCNPCPLNTYSSVTGATACQTCLGGSITKETGAKHYTDCGKVDFIFCTD